MNHHNRSNRTARIVFAVALLGTGIASAQTRPTLELRGASALRAVTPASTSRSNVFQSLDIDRAARPLEVKRVDALSGYSQPRAGEVAVCPAVVAVAVVAWVATQAMGQRAPESWMPSGLEGIPRSNLTNLGMYDR